VKRLPAWIKLNPVLPWGALFLVLSLMVTQYGGEHAKARWAALRAITENHSLHIDNYKEWTIDWARAPSGHYYSNKAPGPIFLALPFFAVTEIFSRALNQNRLDAQGRMPAPGYFPHIVVMLATQLLPFFFLVLWIAHWMIRNRLPPSSVHFFALAAFFGNTAAFYMNSNFGHGVSAVLFLAAFFCWLEKRSLLLGLFLSWSLLCDYGVAFTLPFFLLATFLREPRWQPLWRVALGASPGALAWIWYHYAAFGSPFATANQFTNPEQISTLSHNSFHLWGEYSPIPSFEIIGKLLFGPSRGLLFTQPWMLVVLLFPFLRIPSFPRGTALIATGSLCGLLWMNGGFGGWHGGWSMGPRYLSVAFPALALAVALAWDRFPSWGRSLLWAGLAVALVFRVFVYPFPNMAPDTNLWAYHYGLMLGDHLGTILLRFALALLCIGSAVYWHYRWQKRRLGVPISENPV
jgi:hypothetical protein